MNNVHPKNIRDYSIKITEDEYKLKSISKIIIPKNPSEVLLTANL